MITIDFSTHFAYKWTSRATEDWASGDNWSPRIAGSLQVDPSAVGGTPAR